MAGPVSAIGRKPLTSFMLRDHFVLNRALCVLIALANGLLNALYCLRTRIYGHEVTDMHCG